MTDWQQVAYNNAYNAAKGGQPLDHAISNQPKYAAATKAAYAAYNASKKKKSSSSSSKKSTPTVTAKPIAVATKPKTTAKPQVKDTPAPTLELPSLSLSEGTSVSNQLSGLSSKDSILRQQARVNAAEVGAATGGIHGSQQAGASERAVIDKLTPIAQQEASTALQEDVGNWTNATNQAMETYQNQYKERLAKIGYDAEIQVAMAKASTELSTNLMAAVNSLLNNKDVEFGAEVKNKLTEIFNNAQQNNNTILDLGFTY